MRKKPQSENEKEAGLEKGTSWGEVQIHIAQGMIWEHVWAGCGWNMVCSATSN